MSEHRPPRYLKPMNKVMMAVQKLGIPTGPAMVLTVPGRQDRKAAQHPDDAVRRTTAASTSWPAIPEPTGRPTHARRVRGHCRADAGRDA